jgi:peptide/nickel transport system permease protein
MAKAKVASLNDDDKLKDGETARLPAKGLYRMAARRFLTHPTGMTGAIIIGFLVVFAVFGQALAPYEPNTMSFGEEFASPSPSHWFGTDDFGRDILSRVLYGARISLLVGAIAVSLATVVGSSLGMIAGYGPRWLDEIIMRTMDVLFAFPTILLAIAIMAMLGKGVQNAMIAIGIVYVPIFARIARGEVIATKNEDFVEVARALGAGHPLILIQHILPNILAPIIVEISLSLSFAILAEAALSFFGLGTQPPDPSWGRMLSEGRDFFRQSIWLGIFPGLAIMLTVMGFNFLGDGLRDVLDPKLSA